MSEYSELIKRFDKIRVYVRKELRSLTMGSHLVLSSYLDCIEDAAGRQ
jgi:hypothetical protein